MHVDLLDRPELRVAAVRHVGPYNQISVAFGKLGAIAGPAGLFGRPGAAMVGIYLDNPAHTKPEALRADAGIVIPDGVPLPAGLTEQRIPTGRYARTLHIGPYEQLGEVWARLLGEWLPASGYRLDQGPSYELYLNDPSNAANKDLRTEIYIPLAS